MVKTYGRLREKIKEVYGTLDNFAVAMEKHPATISAKINGKTAWTTQEIEKSCCLLSLKIPQDLDYFFY